MSFLYVGKEENTVEQTLDKKLIYFIDSESEEYKNLVDFNFGEKFLYGRVRRDFRTMYLNSTSENLSSVLSFAIFSEKAIPSSISLLSISINLFLLSSDKPWPAFLKSMPKSLWNSILSLSASEISISLYFL